MTVPTRFYAESGIAPVYYLYGAELMLLCPLDYRYGRDEMKAIFTEENRLLTQLKVEAALARAHAKLGNIPKSGGRRDHQEGRPELRETGAGQGDRGRDQARRHGRSVRFPNNAPGRPEATCTWGRPPTTSSTPRRPSRYPNRWTSSRGTWSTSYRTLAGLAKKHRDTIMMGRTHGQFAIPTTFGFKIAGYITEMMRYQETDLRGPKAAMRR